MKEGNDVYNYMGWISVVFGVVLIAIVVFMFYRMSKALNEMSVEVERLRGALRETRRNIEEARKKLEEV